jgi:homoserine dehydrogenase
MPDKKSLRGFSNWERWLIERCVISVPTTSLARSGRTTQQSGRTCSDALSEAQALGYAAPDPRGDVGGRDSAAKIVIAANVLMGGRVKLSEVLKEGITKMTHADV